MKHCKYITKQIIFALLFLSTSIKSHDILFEGKGAYFLATDQIFKQIYNNGCWEFGLETTGKIIKNIYGFISVDFFNKNGATPIFNSSTKFHSTNFGVGLKYFMPFDQGDFYLGIGAAPTYLRVLNDSPFVQHKTERWGCGGIAKFGAILNLNKSFFMDIFIDYQFTHLVFAQPFGAPTLTTQTILDGALFGVGFGYRFN